MEVGKSQRAVENRENGENWLQNHMWCPNYTRGGGIDDDDDDDDDDDTSNCVHAPDVSSLFSLSHFSSPVTSLNTSERMRRI